MKNSIVDKYLCMRSAGVPLIVATTPDPFDFVSGVISGVPKFIEAADNWTGERAERELGVAFYGWDSVRGIVCFNEAAKNGVTAISDAPDRLGGKPDVALKKLPGAGRNSVVFMHMKQEHLNDPVVRQGIANLRDDFKSDRRTLILVSQELRLPFELTGDVLFIDEQLPTREMIKETINDTLASTNLEFEDEMINRAVEALCGLTQFQVEQLIAINVRKSGILVDQLWEAKKRVIGQTPGLSMFEGTETFDDIIGLDNIKDFLTRLFNGPNRPNSIVFIDEFEKSMNSNTNDSSGVALDQLQNVLTEMQDTDAAGCLLFGIPGVGKSLIAKAAGRTFGVPTLKIDFGAAKGSLVGQSEAQIRAALKRIRAISSEKTLWLSTCNSVDGLPAELRSRFSFGSFFFDIPGATQRGQVWAMYKEKYDIEEKKNPESKNWTPREIRNACRVGHDLSIKLKDAVKYVAPIIRSAKESVERIRSEADGKFIDADRQGMYTTVKSASAGGGGREIDVN